MKITPPQRSGDAGCGFDQRFLRRSDLRVYEACGYAPKPRVCRARLRQCAAPAARPKPCRVAVVLVRRGRRNTVSPGPRTVRRPSDFWCPGMSAGAAPSSGQARSTQKAGFEFRQWACLQTAVVIRLNVKPYKTPHDSACGGRPRAGVAAGSRPCPCGLPVPVDVAARRCRLRPCLWRSPGRQAP